MEEKKSSHKVADPDLNTRQKDTKLKNALWGVLGVWTILPAYLHFGMGERMLSIVPLSSFLSFCSLVGLVLDVYTSPLSDTCPPKQRPENWVLLWLAVCGLTPGLCWFLGLAWYIFLGYPRVLGLGTLYALFLIVFPWLALYKAVKMLREHQNAKNSVPLVLATVLTNSFALPTLLFEWGIWTQKPLGYLV